MGKEASSHLSLIPPTHQAERPEYRLFRSLCALEDSSLRLGRLHEALEQDPRNVVRLFESTRGHLENHERRAIYLDLLRLFTDNQAVDYDAWEQAYNYARGREILILRLVMIQGRIRNHVELPPIDPELDNITLGERKTLARKAGPDQLERLMREIDPRVIHHLLKHPRMTQDKVLRLATRRPMDPMSLLEIVHHPRWGSASAVQEAVAFNVYSPPGLAGGLLPLLTNHARSRFLQGSIVHPEVRAVAMYLRGATETLEQMFQ